MLQGIFRLFLSLFLCLSMVLQATVTESILPELVNPDSIQICKDTLLITDGESVFLYDLENITLKKKFGKKGEGPREFKFDAGGVVKLHASLSDDGIIINSQNRITFFNTDGDYLSEENIKSGVNFIPLGDKYIGYSVVNKNKIMFLVINLYDKEFKFEKEIFRKEYYVQPAKKFNLIRTGLGNKRRAYYQVYKDKLYIEGENRIHVFDSSGKEVSIISPQYKRQRVEKIHINIIHEDLKKLFTSPLMHKIIKDKGYFPEHFPVRAFIIADNLIWIPTYKEEFGRTEFMVIDLTGKFYKRVKTPFHNQSLLIPYPFTIDKNKIYQLFDSDEDEWKLIVSGIRGSGK